MRTVSRPLRHGGVLHTVRADMRLVQRIEEELGSLPALAQRLRGAEWQVLELVALTHMLLQQAGCTTDFFDLGDRMIGEGLGAYRAAVLDLLGALLPT